MKHELITDSRFIPTAEAEHPLDAMAEQLSDIMLPIRQAGGDPAPVAEVFLAGWDAETARRVTILAAEYTRQKWIKARRTGRNK
jgi:hypothetical protein